MPLVQLWSWDSECGHTQSYTPGSTSTLPEAVALVLGMGVHRTVVEVLTTCRVVELVTLVLGCDNNDFFGRRVVQPCLLLYGWVVMMTSDYLSGENCWCPLQMS